MNNADDKSAAANPPEIIFSTSYGALPRFFWYFVIPFLLLVPALFFYRALWFGEGQMIKNIRVPPSVIMSVICPVFWSLCGLLVAIEVYLRRNPQFIEVTTWGVSLPKGRFTSEIFSIAWEDLQVAFEGRNLTGWHVYELTCTDLRDETSVRVTSMFFRDFDDFATLTLILAQHMGQDWTIRGFWPGTIRGKQMTHPIFDRE